MPSWNGVPIPEPPQIKIPNSIPQNFNWNSYQADPSGTFNRFKGAREVHRLNWKGYQTASGNAKKIVLSSPSKKFIAEAGKRTRELRKTATDTKKLADATKKASDIATKVNEILFKNIPGSAIFDKASRVGGILGIFAAIGVVVLIKFQEFVSSRAFDDLSQTGIELTKTNTIAVNNGLKLKNFETKLNKFDQQLNKDAADFARLNKQTETIARNAVDAKKQSNDALYETRQGRTILEAKITESKKQANDALYETRQTKFNLDAKIQQINANIARISSKANDGFQNAVNTTISKIQAELASIKASTKTTKPPTPIDTASITANAVAAAKAQVQVAQSQVSALQAVVSGLSGQLAGALALGGAAINGISNLSSSVASANNTANAALNEAKKNSGIAPLQQSNLSKEFDKKLADFERLSTMTADERFEEFKKENNKALGIRDLQQSNLSKEFDKRQADFERLSTMTADQRFQEFQRTNKESLGLLEKDLTQTKKEIESNKATITKIDTKLGEQAKVNEQALPKLDQIVGILGLIPARAAAAIRPDIATIPQIEAAAAAGTCRTTQPGGCMSRALGDNAANITNNSNTNAANILDAVNTGANAALLTGQQTILSRLGEQLPGGIGGKLSRFADWMHLDRVLNILIFAATVHNALMLSNDIGQTLVGAINNILQLIGLKKEDGSAFDIGSVISGSIENLIKGAIGADNYIELKEAWAKANRIYQATINIFNALQGLSSAILTGLEMTAGKIGKIGNALRKSGEVLESAYGWMNPQPKFNRVTQSLESLQNGASTIQMVTQAPLDVVNAVTELTTANTEFVKAIKEDDKPDNKGKESPEPDKLKADQAAAKLASASLDLSEIDLDPDD